MGWLRSCFTGQAGMRGTRRPTIWLRRMPPRLHGSSGSLSVSGRGLMRGPVHDKVGITNITTLAFGSSILSIISNSPFLSDDLDPMTVTDASEAAAKLGLKLSMVDAHNSVDGESRPQSQISRSHWEIHIREGPGAPRESIQHGVRSFNGDGAETRFRRQRRRDLRDALRYR